MGVEVRLRINENGRATASLIYFGTLSISLFVTFHHGLHAHDLTYLASRRP